MNPALLIPWSVRNSVSALDSLRRWRDLVNEHGEAQAFPGHGNSRDEELTQLKRELAKVKEERDFLKEAARYFAKESK